MRLLLNLMWKTIVAKMYTIITLDKQDKGKNNHILIIIMINDFKLTRYLIYSLNY